MPHFSSKVRHFRRKGVHAVPTGESRGAVVAALFSPRLDVLPGEHPAPLNLAPDVDVCRSLFTLSQRCQIDYLDEQGIELLFDVSGGEMPVAMCHKLELLIESMVADIAQGPSQRTGGDVTLTVRHQDSMWIVGIEERGGQCSGDCDQRRSALAQGVIHDLGGTWRVESRPPNGCITAFMFPAHAAEAAGPRVTFLKH